MWLSFCCPALPSTHVSAVTYDWAHDKKRRQEKVDLSWNIIWYKESVLLLLAPTGALIVTVVYYTSKVRAATF